MAEDLGLGSVVKTLGEQLGGRWLISVFLPSLLFWILGGVTFALNFGLQKGLDKWTGLTATSQVIASGAGLAWVAVFAYMIAMLQRPLLQLYEGYFQGIPFINILATCLKPHEEAKRAELRRKLDALIARGAANTLDDAGKRELRETFYRFATLFPFEESHLMPTRLGNLIAAAEEHADRLYGINSAVMWPRLYPLLPDRFIALIDGARSSLDTLLFMTTLSWLFALGWGTYWAVAKVAGLALASATGLPLAWVFYRTALNPAMVYSTLIRVAFDIYRWELLDAVRWPLPAGISDEAESWQNLALFLYQGIPPAEANFKYVHDASRTRASLRPFY